MIRTTAAQFSIFEQNLYKRMLEDTLPPGGVARVAIPGPRKFDRRAHDAKPENIVDKQILDFLRWMNWQVSRNHVGTFVPLRVAKAVPVVINGWDIVRINEKGMPDRKAERILPGRPGITERFWYEVKRSGAKPSPEQKEWIRKHRALGELAEWFDAFKDDFGDEHSAFQWYCERFGRHAGDAPGVGM